MHNKTIDEIGHIRCRYYVISCHCHREVVLMFLPPPVPLPDTVARICVSRLPRPRAVCSDATPSCRRASHPAEGQVSRPGEVCRVYSCIQSHFSDGAAWSVATKCMSKPVQASRYPTSGCTDSSALLVILEVGIPMLLTLYQCQLEQSRICQSRRG